MDQACLNDLERVEQFLNHRLFVEGVSLLTRDAYKRDLGLFTVWLHQNNSQTLMSCDQDSVTDFLVWRDQEGDGRSTLARRVSAIRRFFLSDWGQNSNNPISGLRQPKQARPLPKSIEQVDVDSLLNAPDIESDLGVRDKAILELIYATGLRVTELVQLRFDQLDLDRGVIRVVGKGNRERIIPIGEESLLWLQRYRLVMDQPAEYIFSGRSPDKPMTRQAVWYRIKALASKAGLPTDVSPHTLRHAFATHLVDNGADIRAVQLFLGHSSLSTTQIYTKVSRHRLSLLHRQHHPRG